MKPGDRVRITTTTGTVEGVLMPEQPGIILIKLDTGYNLGIDKKRVKNTKTLKKHVSKKPVVSKYKTDKTKPTILILHTGGTIASKVDYETGAVIARFTPEEIIAQFPELHDVCNIRSELLSNMWSEDIRFVHYNMMAQAVAQAVKKKVDGVIITHGTDTMHYTAAALTFALENIPIPVVLVGAQRSSDRPSSDAKLNLLGTAQFIAKGQAGVFVAMHETTNDDSVAIIHGCCARKNHSSRRDAFKSVNRDLVARVHRNGQVNWIQKNDAIEGKFSVKPFKEKLKVGMLKIHPQMHPEEFSAYESFNGLVIEGTGLGHAPINDMDKHTRSHKKIANAINTLTQKMPVVMSTQAINGRVNMNVYSSGKHAQELGIIGNYSTLHPELAFIKLAWLLSNHKKSDVAQLMTTNLRGEQQDRITL